MKTQAFDNKVDNTLVVQELIRALEPLMRRIIREELQQIINTPVYYLNPDTPLYTDMLDIQERKESGKLEFMTHQEVWGE
ncbi:MAG: hypothetical protein HQK63_15195 [Desulfamplus sp.]|nr:hypothetical protein [Desulfamplus sp.]